VHGIEHHKNTHHTNKKKKFIFTLIDTRREDKVFWTEQVINILWIYYKTFNFFKL